MTNPSPQQIKQARERAGLTQQQCADLLYVTVNTWKKWEYGDMHPEDQEDIDSIIEEQP